MVGRKQFDPPAPKIEVKGDRGRARKKPMRRPCGGCGKKDVEAIAKASAEVTRQGHGE